MINDTQTHDHNHHDHHDQNHDHLDHHDQNHDHHHHGDFKQLFFRSLPLGFVILILSPMMGIKLPFQFSFAFSDVLVAILATILLVYGGRPFYQGALDEFKSKAPGMMALVSLGISVSYIYSIYAVLGRYLANFDIMDFFFEFASLILIMLLGHWIEMKAVGDAGDAQKSLAALLPKEVHIVLADGSTARKAINELRVGNTVKVQAGENIPADGIIVSGNSQINESLLTGEFKPVEKGIGDAVIGGSTNGDGILFVEITEMGEKSFISQVQSLIRQAQSQPSRAESLAHKVAGWLFYIAITVAAVAFLVWMYLSDLQTAILFMITTLVIACPHALGLAIPLVVARSTSLGASRGLLVKNRQALEFTNKADIMILDKTGTLTTGDFKVLALEQLDESYDKETILALLYGIEAGSSHPIAQSISQYVKAQNIEPIKFDEINLIQGIGIEGSVGREKYRLISKKAYKQELDMDIPYGATVSILVKGDQAIGAIMLGDELKTTSVELINYLKSNQIKPIIATGDNEIAAKAVAEVLNVEFRANQSPEDKYSLVKQFKDDKKIVIMVGDGVNDAPSLALADVGIAVGAGTQVAIDSADVILTQSDPKDITSFIDLSRRTNRKMVENLAWGAGYNFIAIPIAAGILAPLGLILTPAIGAILMSLSTVVVALNAMLLKLE